MNLIKNQYQDWYEKEAPENAEASKRIESISKEGSGEIAVAGVGEEGDDGFSLIFRALCQLNGSPHRSAGGDTDKDAFRFADPLAGCKSGVVFDRDDLIINIGIQHGGNKACADALNLVRAGRALAQNGGGRRLYGDDLHLRVLAL